MQNFFNISSHKGQKYSHASTIFIFFSIIIKISMGSTFRFINMNNNLKLRLTSACDSIHQSYDWWQRSDTIWKRDDRPNTRWIIHNTLKLGQNGHHFLDATFKYIFFAENCCILEQISLKFVPRGSINNLAALVQMMAWCLTGTKPLSEPTMAWFTDTYMHHSAAMS